MGLESRQSRTSRVASVGRLLEWCNVAACSSESEGVRTLADPYPPTEPYDRGMLDVGDSNLVYWETRGNPDGKPALIVHGGPGSSCEGSTGRSFDPDRYRVVLFDQRGCGRSTPHA